jgi:hypothetical protein
MATTVQPLKKVTLSLSAGDGPGKFAPAAPPAPLEFIFGAASDGLCPFETALAGRHEGANLAVSVKSSAAHQYFGHIFHVLGDKLGDRMADDPICLEITVIAITDADDREVVRAVAQALTHGGCGGSCGCGCGG